MQGISGREELVRMAIFRECAEVLGEENVKIDRTGNVIAHKACRKADAPRVMVAAHMDEVGLMVINAADDGLLQVRNIGGVDPRVLVSKRVKVGYDVPVRDGKPAQEALNGVIGAMAIHLQSAADRKHVLPIDNLYVDIGAKDKDEALAKAPEGTPVTFATSSAPHRRRMPFVQGGATTGWAATTCCGLLHARCDLRYVVSPFTCQEEVGCRGATGAAFRIQPDVGSDAGGHHRQRRGRCRTRPWTGLPAGQGRGGQLYGQSLHSAAGTVCGVAASGRGQWHCSSGENGRRRAATTAAPFSGPGCGAKRLRSQRSLPLHPLLRPPCFVWRTWKPNTCWRKPI